MRHIPVCLTVAASLLLFVPVVAAEQVAQPQAPAQVAQPQSQAPAQASSSQAPAGMEKAKGVRDPAEKKEKRQERFKAMKAQHVEFLEKRLACFKAANAPDAFKKCREEAKAEKRQNLEKAKAARQN
ncbi:MAG: hypothetical protein HQL63_05825 [Magnetococcales bacterium]|nr:hypothetical protein [Magnetococcales bacterium]